MEERMCGGYVSSIVCGPRPLSVCRRPHADRPESLKVWREITMQAK